MNKKLLFIVTFLFLVLHAFAQSGDSVVIKKFADEILTNGKAYENLHFLCKKIGARLSGSPQAQKAVEATARMLKAAGADTVYFQSCMVPHWVRGEKEQGIIQLKNGQKHTLNLCALGNSEGTGKKGLTASVIEVNSFAQLNQLGTAGIKGKIVFFNFPMNQTYVETFWAYGESGVSRTRGAAKASKYGAAGVLVRSLAINLNDYPHTGVTVYNDSFPKIPALAISTNDAEWLSVQLKTGTTATAFIRNTSTMLPDEPSFNVIGELRGSEFPAEIITVGGHLDSWDLAEGAHDDGTGVVQSIEVIRALKASGLTPKRTIRAVMFMNEENGRRGGDKYADLAKEKKENHLFALESDEGGFAPRKFSLGMSTEKFEKIERWLKLFYPYGVYGVFNGEGGSDIDGLQDMGIPVAGFSPDNQRYFDIHHAATDVFENVSKRELHLGAVNITALIWLVSEYGL